MRAIFMLTFVLSFCSHATETINCYFDKFHQANHQNDDFTGYAVIEQSLEIIKGITSDATRKLDGKFRASNSVNWVIFKPFGDDKYPVFYAGDFGELLTLDYESGTGGRSPSGWYKASLVSSLGANTHTHLGKCTVNQIK